MPETSVQPKERDRTLSQANPDMFTELAVSLKNLYKRSVKRTKKDLTHKGYDTTGYGYQFVADRLNVVLPKYGLHWATQDEIKLLKEYPSKDGRIQYEYAGKLTLLFLDDNRNAVEARACYGGHQAATHADAMKGAYTNAFKKTAALYGVGADAYEGAVDEDYQPTEEPAIDPITSAMMPIVTGEELKQIEKEITAVAGVTNKAELENAEKLVTALVGKVNGKQIAYLRKLLESKKKEIK